jgi:DNA repair exonuclease SbcCD ATPase subunit
MFSYGESNVFIVTPNVTQLVGKNGDGKSSIATILEELLYNKNSRGIKKADILNRYSGSKEYSGFVEFTVGSKNYVLDKRVSSTTKVRLYEDAKDISGHTTTQTYKLVESLLGMEFSTFTKLVYQSMVSSLDFLSATDANRKKFLVSLLGLEKYVEAEKTFKDAVKASKSDMDTIQGAVGTIKDWLEKNSVIPEPEIEILVLAESPEDMDELIAKKAELSNITMHNKVVRENLDNIDNLDSIVEVAFAAPPIVTDSGLSSAKEALAVANSVCSRARAEVAKIKGIKEECHVCGSKLEVGNKAEMLEKAEDELNSATTQLTVHKTKVSELETFAKEIESEVLQYNKYASYLAKLEAAKAKLDSTKPTEILDSSSLKITISALESSIKKHKSLIDYAIARNTEIASTNATLEYRKEQLDKFKKDLIVQSAKLDEVSVTTARLDVLAKVLGNKGLIAYKVESMVKVFEDLINKYLHVLADGEFALSFSVEDTKLVLNTYSRGRLVDIKSLSSGEFNRVNTATLLAVRKVMTSISKTDVNLLILDEVVSVLDQQGKDTLIDVLLRENNLSSIVVSHGYEHPLADKITVIKENNISRLE